jgi:DNA polymerase (family 10)
LRERLRGEIPASVTELLKIPGLGAKKVSALYHDLTVETPEQLLRMAHEERIRQLHGFSEKTEASILQAIEAHGNKARRYPLSAATQYATALLAYLQRVPGVHQVTLAGSYRRRRETTVGDLHILASAASASPVIQRFLSFMTRWPKYCRAAPSAPA